MTETFNPLSKDRINSSSAETHQEDWLVYLPPSSTKFWKIQLEFIWCCDYFCTKQKPPSVRSQTLCTLRPLWDWCGSFKPQCDLWPPAVQPQWEAASTLSPLPDGWQSRNSLYSSLPASGTSLHVYSLNKHLAPGHRDKQWAVTAGDVGKYRNTCFKKGPESLL